MHIYIINIVLILFLGIIFLDRFKGKHAKKIYCALVTVQLGFIAGLRSTSVGPDSSNYAWLFKKDSTMDIGDILFKPTDLEKGYLLLEHAVSRVSTDSTALFLVIAFFFTVVVARCIYKNSSEPCLSFVLFVTLGFFTFSMTGLRQTVAMGVTLLGFEFIKKKKLLPFLTTVGIASLFHLSSAIFLPAYFIAHKRITKSYVLMAAVAIPAAYVFKGPVFSFLSRVSGYGYDPFGNEGPYILITMMIGVFLGAFIQRESVIERNPDNIIYYNFSLFSIVFAMLTFINPSALRVAYYYHIYLILFIPEIIFSISDKKLRRIIYGLALVGVLTLELRVLSSGSPFVPYLFFWQ